VRDDERRAREWLHAEAERRAYERLAEALRSPQLRERLEEATPSPNTRTAEQGARMLARLDAWLRDDELVDV
jgi:hypothetical protein